MIPLGQTNCAKIAFLYFFFINNNAKARVEKYISSYQYQSKVSKTHDVILKFLLI